MHPLLLELSIPQDLQKMIQLCVIRVKLESTSSSVLKQKKQGVVEMKDFFSFYLKMAIN